jgi:hypothetical protein
MKKLPELLQVGKIMKLNFITIIVFAFTLALSAAAQQKPQTAEEAREEICKKVVCREPKTVNLKLNNKEVLAFDFPKIPYVAEGYINVLMGEKIYVEFDEAANTLTNARYVEQIKAAEKTVTFELTQTDSGTILSVKNPFSKDIIYDCLIQNYKTDGLQKTSIIPVKAKIMSFEMWGQPIPQVVISNVRFVSNK